MTVLHRVAAFPRIARDPDLRRAQPPATTCDPAYSAAVAAEVAARYGVAVICPVQIIPRGVSGLPDVTDQDSWRQMKDRLRANQARVQRVVKARVKERAAAEPEAQPKVRVPPPRAARLIERDHLIRTMVAAGKSSAEIAQAIDLTICGARSAIAALGLRAKSAPRPVKAPVERAPRAKPKGRVTVDHAGRAAEIARLIATGKTRDEVAAHLGFARRSLDRMICQYKLDVPRMRSMPQPVVDVARIVSLYQRKTPICTIAKETHHGTETVIAALKSAGVYRRTIDFDAVAANRKRVADLHERGMSAPQIRAETGLTRKQVELALAAFGLKPRAGAAEPGAKRGTKPKGPLMLTDAIKAQIGAMAAQGFGAAEIAGRLGMSEARVGAIVAAQGGDHGRA